MPANRTANSNRISNRQTSRYACFTLVQVLVVLGVMALLAAVFVPTFSRMQANARRAQCDVKLKAVALALDAFRQENHTFPKDLKELTEKGYLSAADALHCPADPRATGSYADFYVIRARHDKGELPIVCCPFHEESTGYGTQARLGTYTTQFATKPAALTSGNNVSVLHPGADIATAGFAGMELHGGDRISTGTFGTAQITFADGSIVRLKGGADVTVLQSFVDGYTGAPLYSLVRQVSGECAYTIHHGSRFDVVTPAATAGARGTEFIVTVSGTRPEDTTLYVVEGTVIFTNQQNSVVAPVGKLMNVLDIQGLVKGLLGGVGGLLGGLLGG